MAKQVNAITFNVFPIREYYEPGWLVLLKYFDLDETNGKYHLENKQNIESNLSKLTSPKKYQFSYLYW